MYMAALKPRKNIRKILLRLDKFFCPCLLRRSFIGLRSSWLALYGRSRLGRWFG